MSPDVQHQDQSYQNIIATYTVVHKLFFGIGTFLIILVVGLIYARLQFISATDFSVRDGAVKEREKNLLSGMQLVIHQYDNHPYVKLFIKQGNLVTTDQRIQSTNNLVTYKWYVLPRSIGIAPSSWLLTLDQFAQETLSGQRNTEALQNYMDTLIKTTLQENLDSSNSSHFMFLSFGDSLIDYFGVSCVLQEKVIDTFCNRAVDDMVSVLPIYDLQKNVSDLEKLSSVLTSSDHAWPFCDGIKQYIFLSNDTTDPIKNIMNQCGEEYERFYNEFATFRNIQEQLDKTYINPSVTASPLLNAYKLVSTQQLIYNELQWGKFNEVRIKSYNKYVEELLRKSDTIQWFYFDSIGLFNNNYLLQVLTQMVIKLSSQENKEIKSVLDNLRSINEWSILEWYPWLNAVVKSVYIATGSSSTIIDTTVIEKPLLEAFNDTYSFEDFLITSVQTGAHNDLLVKWSFRMGSEASLKGNIRADANLIRKDGKFIITSIFFSQYPNLTQNVRTMLTTQSYTIPSLHELLYNDGQRLNTKAQSLCDVIKVKKELVSCTDSQIVFSKSSELSGVITYTIDYQGDGILQSYKISKKSLSDGAKRDLWVPETSASTMLVFIDKLLSYQLPAVVETATGTIAVSNVSSAELVQLRDDFSVLNAKLENAYKTKDAYAVYFELHDFHFIAAYTISKKQILWLIVVVGEKQYTLRNTSLSLSNEKAQDVVMFRNDPKTYLLQKDPLTVKKALL